jgi:hypothetical protein
MNVQEIVAELRQELSRIERAIAAITGLGDESTSGRRRGRPAGSKNVSSGTGQKRRTMSASARARISAAQKARWAKQKGKSAQSKTKASPAKSSGRRPMSPAARKRLSALMKARWAARKKAA